MDKVRNWNGTVHYAANGVPACGPISTHKLWLVPSVATVNCKRCIAKFGAGTPGLSVNIRDMEITNKGAAMTTTQTALENAQNELRRISRQRKPLPPYSEVKAARAKVAELKKQVEAEVGA